MQHPFISIVLKVCTILIPMVGKLHSASCGAVQTRDLSEWHEDPERFHAQADVGSWQEHPRSVAEALFRTLLQVDLLPI